MFVVIFFRLHGVACGSVNIFGFRALFAVFAVFIVLVFVLVVFVLIVVMVFMHYPDRFNIREDRVVVCGLCFFEDTDELQRVCRMLFTVFGESVRRYELVADLKAKLFGDRRTDDRFKLALEHFAFLQFFLVE